MTTGFAASQAWLFAASCAAGVMVGVVFDAFRIIRGVVPRSNIAVGLMDGAFWAAAALIVFFAMLNVNFAYIRPYNIVGAGLGAAVYFATVSRIVMGAFNAVKRFVEKIISNVKGAITKKVADIRKKAQRKREAEQIERNRKRAERERTDKERADKKRIEKRRADKERINKGRVAKGRIKRGKGGKGGRQRTDDERSADSACGGDISRGRSRPRKIGGNKRRGDDDRRGKRAGGT